MFNIVLKKTNGTEKVNFGEEQLVALETLKHFIKNESNKSSISLVGSAGTGKTSMVIELIEFLESIGVAYALAAPTHKAKMVMEALTGRSSTTLHQLLALSPNLEIFELDMRDLDFFSNTTKESNQIPYKGIIIVDEASMVNDTLFDFIINKCKENKSRVIWVGDSKQIRPVKSSELSKVFSLDNKIELTKIYRQKEDSPVLDILTTLRDKSLTYFETSIGKEDSLIVYNNATEFIKSAKNDLIETVKSGNVLNTKLLAFTNARVNGFNSVCRKLIFQNEFENQFLKGDILMGKDNLEYEDFKFYNGLDYIITNTPFLTKKYLPYYDEEVYGYDLYLYDTVYKETGKVFILSIEKNTSRVIEGLSKWLEQIRFQAINYKQRGFFGKAREFWSKYYTLFKSFGTFHDLYYDNRIIKKRTFAYAYAITTHAAQGSSYNSVYVDIQNINKCPDENVVRELQYVSISRTRGNAYLLC